MPMPGRKLGKEVLSDLMAVFAGIAVQYQPALYSKLAIRAASVLAPFESPTYRAVAVTDPATPQASAARVGCVVLPRCFPRPFSCETAGPVMGCNSFINQYKSLDD
jgi:hypothetical protein